MNILDTTQNEGLFARWFPHPDSWACAFAFLAAIFGLPMSDEQRALAQRHTGRILLPAVPCREAWLCCGRRSGKSLLAALIAIFLTCFKDYRAFLTPGESAVAMLIGADRRQAHLLMKYCKALARIPALASRVVRETRDSIEFSNRTIIEVHTASYHTTRGYTLAAVIADEIAFWQTDEFGAEPDSEIITALRAGMTTIPGSLLLGLSSPHARRGELWRANEAHFGNDASAAIFWNADSLSMNPTLDARIIEEAFERDPVIAASEYGADGHVSFRSDVERFITLEALEHCIDRDRPEILEAA